VFECVYAVARIKSEREIDLLEARLARPGGGGMTITDRIVITNEGAERLSGVPITP
jgi:hypothetical protein